MPAPVFAVGQFGPEGAISVHLTRPSTFTGSMATATRRLAVTITMPDQTVLVLGPSAWTWAALKSASAVAVYVPEAADFTTAGIAKVEFSLSLNGQVFPTFSQRIRILNN